MKLLGMALGRRMGNSEIAMREALMAAEERGGIDVEIIRLHDFEIKPCTGCNACAPGPGKPMKSKADMCPIKDDVGFLWEKLLECEGLIIASPIYILTPPGIFKDLCDRMLLDAGFMKTAEQLMGVKPADGERVYKPRAAGFIALGGAPLQYWVSLGLPLLNLLTFPRKITVVDQMQILGAGTPPQVLLDTRAMQRARKLGENVAANMGRPANEMKWMGDEAGTCPVCHCDVMIVGKESPIECAICGIKGDVAMDGNKIRVTFPEEEKAKSRLTYEGSRIHLMEIRDVMMKWMQGKDGVSKEVVDKYRLYKPYTKPPARAETAAGKAEGEI
jgi:hypothetical protein